MVSFQLRHNLLITVFIIVVIGVMWLLMQGLSYSFSALQGKAPAPLTENEIVSQEVSYIEKIDNFALQEFDESQQLSHFVKAKSYFNFKESPALLLDPRVTTYNEKGKADYVLTSDRAHYLDSGEIKFKGKVDIHSSTGVTHKMNTQELLVSTKSDDLISNKKVTYLGERAKIIAQGLHMKAKEDKMKLIGITSINQDTGQKILTKDLYIDQSNGQKHYYSKNNTTYLAIDNKIYADGIDMDMRKEIVQLLGKVKILQDSGSKINTKDLIVDQSGESEIYRTKERIHYQSKVANIHATGMRYDAKNQKIKLTGGVVGRYE
ncbi:MAG TPA: LPS export ABC transporter periplasmic protein LptC [Gammaproteobacteria bacterium]|mgnify:FL=1|jgi:LPS export ABC transporter protein LptC|nr:LPS export ABC transporter periplasmic protein LptC [Gammaproteobacteria bacterium]HAE70412.1 LPS export ABC transporter periplasmic protein LptC [Gammaproteobacteria bacterium]HAG47435.1 LPS export ABC transporter periplasmic protein LptC [Gammaproteobacteria bacterium]HAN32905.1 LPS export ABC transporter periplasmic protein LptC [Gammaproteobacteria bacterium]HAO53008.1 LPS export ABC transporter periplasmic protein LptC [Gammaproteobacteria bacterium]